MRWMQWIWQDHSCLLEVSPYLTNVRVHCMTTRYTAYWCWIGHHCYHIKAQRLKNYNTSVHHIVHHDVHRAITLLLADLTLTTDRLMELFQSVRDPDGGGLFERDIGCSLGLPQSVIAGIKGNFQSTTRRKEAYLDTYTHQHPCPTWKKVAEALTWYSLYQKRNEVENTYIQGMHVVNCSWPYRDLECTQLCVLLCVSIIEV